MVVLKTHTEIFLGENTQTIFLSISILAVAEGKHKIKAKEPVASFNFETVQHWGGDKLLLHSCWKGKHQAIAGNIDSTYIHTHSYVCIRMFI